jgi:hypothetical protein
MRTRTHTLLVIGALLGISAAPARSQNAPLPPPIDRRWLAYLGCWERVESAKSHVCVVPTANPDAVDLLTIVKGEVGARERIDASSAEWSAHGQRLYMRSDDSRDSAGIGTGVIAMTRNGDWLYIQGMTVAGQTGVRVQRYREATSELLVPDEVASALQLNLSATLWARAAAGAPLSTDDVIEASRHLDASVLEALLVERAEPFTLDAKRLIALADAGVPSRVIDLMVALSYPRAFAINTASRQGSYGQRTAPTEYVTAYNPLCYDYDSMLSYGTDDCTGLGSAYGYGYGWYPGGYPVTIIYSGASSGGGSRAHGRVVNGEGYVKGGDTGPEFGTPRPSDTWSPRSSGSSSGSSGAGAPSTSSSSGSGEQRTAKPRPPQ